MYTQALHILVSTSYLVPSTVLFHVSPRDKFLQYEKEEKSQIKNFPTAKELREAKERAEARLRREQNEALKAGMTVSSYYDRIFGIVADRPSVRNEKLLSLAIQDLRRCVCFKWKNF